MRRPGSSDSDGNGAGSPVAGRGRMPDPLRSPRTRRDLKPENIPRPIRCAFELLLAGVPPDTIAADLVRRRSYRALGRLRLPATDRRWLLVSMLLRALRQRTWG